MKKYLWLFLLLASPLHAQLPAPSLQNPLGGQLLASTTNCSVVSSCVWQKLTVNAGTTVVTLAGTFSATVLVEESGDGGNTWTTANTLSAVGVTSYSTNGFTDIRLRCSAFTSGNVAVNISTGYQQVQSVVSGSTGNGTGSSSNPASPIMGFYLTNACPTTNTGNCFNTPANTQQDVTASWGTGSGVITITDGKFTAADVGKRAFGYVTCNAFTNTLDTNAHSGAITTGTIVTITGFTDSNHVTISANPANAVSLTAGVGGCFIWGTPDDSGAAALSTAVAAAPSCPKIFLAASYYMLTTPPGFMVNNPASCFAGPSQYEGGTANAPSGFGNIYYSGGLEIEGRGRSATFIYLTPGFPETGTCTNGPLADACFVRQLEGRWADFSITGGDNSQTVLVSVQDLIDSIGPGSFDNFNCFNWGGGNTSLSGLAFIQGWDQMRQVDISGCGGVGISIKGSSTFPFGLQVRSENSSNAALQVATPAAFTCYLCGFFVSQYQTNINPVRGIANSGTFKCVECDVEDSGSVGTFPRQCVWNFANGASYQQIGGDISCGAGTLNIAINNTTASNVFLRDLFLKAGATGNTYKDAAGAVLYDQGGVSGYNSGGGVAALNGQVIGESNSAVLYPLVTGNLVISAGWGSTATKTAFSGGIFPSQFTITNSGTGQGASPTIAYTFANALPISPLSCTATQVGGTNATGTFTSSALSKTGVTFTFSLTPTASSTEIVQMTCITP